jgi:hypothetical protein
LYNAFHKEIRTIGVVQSFAIRQVSPRKEVRSKQFQEIRNLIHSKWKINYAFLTDHSARWSFLCSPSSASRSPLQSFIHRSRPAARERKARIELAWERSSSACTIAPRLPRPSPRPRPLPDPALAKPRGEDHSPRRHGWFR